MLSFLVLLFTGILCIIFGVLNTHGNISSIHYYHRHRVSEEDRVSFGRLVGLGTIIIGIGVIVFGCLSAATSYTGKDIFMSIGSVIMGVCITFGLVISFYAMIKYNKGIF